MWGTTKVERMKTFLWFQRKTSLEVVISQLTFDMSVFRQEVGGAFQAEGIV